MLIYDARKTIKSDHCLRQYTHFTPVCNTSNIVPMQITGDHMHHSTSQLWKDFGDLKFSRALLYRGVIAYQDNTWTSIMKMDSVSGLSPQLDQQMFHDAMELTWSKLRCCLETQIDYFPSFTSASSATFPYRLLGYRNKGEVMQDPDFMAIVWDPISRVTWWRVSSKHEYLSVDDIIAGKVRTFIIPPMHLLFWQKAFGAGDENIKRFQPGDIRYGVSFQYGGFDRMIRKLCEDPELMIWYTLDVSGWDRVICLMRECWELRKRGLEIPDTLLPIWQWMLDNTISSELLLPNGDVIWKDWGNNSGSGTTTGDNCIMHQIISDYTKLYVDELGIARIETHLAHLFGDDNLARFPNLWTKEELPAKCEAFKELLRYVYKLFGLTVKESAVDVQLGPQGLKFLGAAVVKIGNHYVPSYDSGRIYAALTTEIDGHTTDAEISKCYALMHLAWNDCELFDVIYNTLNRVMTDRSIDSPFLESLRTKGLPSREMVIHRFWLGSEDDVSLFITPDFSPYVHAFKVFFGGLDRGKEDGRI
jgi:hypothetical protein